MKTGVFYSGRQEGSCPHGPFPQPLRCAGGRCLAPRGWERWGDAVVGQWAAGWWGGGVPAGTCTARVWAPCAPSNSGSSNCPVWFRTGKRGQNLFQAQLTLAHLLTTDNLTLWLHTSVALKLAGSQHKGSVLRQGFATGEVIRRYTLMFSDVTGK